MSLRRKMQRTALRVVREEEAAFRQTLSLVGALLDLGLEISEMQIGFVPSQAATKHAIVPVVIVRQEEKAFTYRFDNYELQGTQEFIDRRWREWLDELQGADRDLPRTRIDAYYRASDFANKSVRDRLRTSLRQAGICLPGWPAIDGRI